MDCTGGEFGRDPARITDMLPTKRNPKPRPNHQLTLRILRAMTPEQKLDQVFKLNERGLELMRIGLRQRFPDLDDAAFEKVYLQWRAHCRNRTS